MPNEHERVGQHKLDYATPPPRRKKVTVGGVIGVLARDLLRLVVFLVSFFAVGFLVRWLLHS